MKGLYFTSRSSFLSVCILTFLSLASYQEASSVDRSTMVPTLNGRVIIKLEPHGSVRAKVFQGKNLQYEFVLDRETRQDLLTRNIDRANVYLIGEHEEELVIDDLKTQKRYLLSIFDRKSRLRNIPPARSQTITIRGYSTSLMH